MSQPGDTRAIPPALQPSGTLGPAVTNSGQVGAVAGGQTPLGGKCFEDHNFLNGAHNLHVIQGPQNTETQSI